MSRDTETIGIATHNILGIELPNIQESAGGPGGSGS